jgi:hypothetical protein
MPFEEPKGVLGHPSGEIGSEGGNKVAAFFASILSWSVEETLWI